MTNNEIGWATDKELLTEWANIKDRDIDDVIGGKELKKELQKRGLIDPDEPTDTFKSVEQL